jgi:hypothetical protein
MIPLVDVDTAKAQVRLDHDVDDEILEFHLIAASRAVLRYIKVAEDQYIDSSGEIIVDSNGVSAVPEDVQMAVLVLTSMFFNDRTGSATWPDGYLPPPVKALLIGLRDPSMA